MRNVHTYNAQEHFRKIAEGYGFISLLSNMVEYVKVDSQPWDATAKEYMLIEAKNLLQAIDVITPTDEITQA